MIVHLILCMYAAQAYHNIVLVVIVISNIHNTIKYFFYIINIASNHIIYCTKK